MRDATKASIHFRIRQGAGGRISNLESRIQYNHQPMNKYFFACAGIVALLTNVVVAGDRPATIEEFYDAGAKTRVIAHRGFSSAAPENTLAAVRAAIEVGADMVEIDVTLTADGQVVVIHDETVDRTSDGSGEVFRFKLAEIQTLDAGSWFSPAFAGERIPTLDAVLAEVEGRILLNVEIKSEAVDRGIVAKVAAAIRERGMTDQVVVSSFAPTALDQMQGAAPEIRTAVLFSQKLHKGQDPVEIVNGVGASVLHIKRTRLTRKMLRRCHENGIPVGIYTVNKPRRMRRMAEKGIDAVFTDHPDRFLEILNPAPSAAPSPNLEPAVATP